MAPIPTIRPRSTPRRRARSWARASCYAPRSGWCSKPTEQRRAALPATRFLAICSSKTTSTTGVGRASATPISPAEVPSGLSMPWWRGATRVPSAPASSSIGTPAPTMSASSRSARMDPANSSPIGRSSSWHRRGDLDGFPHPADIVRGRPPHRCGWRSCRRGKRGASAMYSEITRSIKVSVEPFYLEDQSSPAEGRYVWAYHVRIENGGLETVQLRNRHWQITDNRGQMQEVRGAGVVGEQPVLAPGESFEYTSGPPLPTPSGIMVGSYEMETRGGDSFWVRVPAFSLDSPHQAVRLN